MKIQNRIYCFLAFIVAAGLIFCGFNKYHNINVASPQNIVPNINVDISRPGMAIPSDFLGFSYEINALSDPFRFSSKNTVFKTLVRHLSPCVIRLGGAYVDNHYWTNGRRNSNTGDDSITQDDLDTLFTFLKQTNSKVILGLNLINANQIDISSEIQYVLTHSEDRLTAFEIGNEPEEYHKLYRPTNYNFNKYNSEYLSVYNSLVNKLGNFPLCGPSSARLTSFVVPFVKSDASSLKFVSFHMYPCGSSNTPFAIYKLLDNSLIKSVSDTVKKLNSLVTSKNLTYRVDECNNFNDEGKGVSDRFASALWGLDFMFTLAENNCKGINFHGGGRGFTPIALNNKDVSVRPLYYAMLFFRMAAQGRILPLNINSSISDLKGYATLSSDNRVFITLINKNIANTMSVNINISSEYSHGDVIRLTAPTIFSRDSISLKGGFINSKGDLIDIQNELINRTNNKLKINVGKASAVLLVLNK